MPEWKLDRLLAEYGLPAHGDLASKRDFAMGAFLWPDNCRNGHNPNNCNSYNIASIKADGSS